jgi:hypothetical protein
MSRSNKEILGIRQEKFIKVSTLAAISWAFIHYLNLPLNTQQDLIRALSYLAIFDTALILTSKSVARKIKSKRKYNSRSRKRKENLTTKFQRSVLAIVVILMLAGAIEIKTQHKPVTKFREVIGAIVHEISPVFAYDEPVITSLGDPQMVGQNPAAIQPTPQTQPEAQQPTYNPETNPSREDILNYIREIFGSEADHAITIVTTCENMNLDIHAVNRANSNGTADYGIFQINSVHIGDPDDPNNPGYGLGFTTDWRENVRVARAIQLSGGWSQWSCSDRIGVIPYYKK